MAVFLTKNLKINKMKLKDFKNEFRLMCTDTWGNALDAWFECAGRLYKRHQKLPEQWEYKPGLITPCDKESYFYEIFKNSTVKELWAIGNFLYRYCQLLKYKEVDY